MKNDNNIYSEIIKKHNLTAESFNKGKYLFKEGDLIDYVCYIEKGEVFIMRENFILWTARNDEIIGISSYMLPGNSYGFSARTGDTSIIYKIPVTIFRKELTNNTTLSQSIMQNLCSRIDKIMLKTTSFTNKSSRNRLIELLIDHSRASKSLNLSYKLSEISELVGVSARTIRSMLNELEEKKLIRRFKDTLEILDLKGLEIIGSL